ncbi:MAG: hypothetical protein ABI760_24990 [Ferruginibacter sp.]
MEIDIIEIRAYNYFEHNHRVKQLNETDLTNITTLLPRLKPLIITKLRLSRLNFSLVSTGERRISQKFANNISFNFLTVKDEKQLLVINEEIKLPHIIHIHQLQNLYYDLTGDVLKIPGTKV